VTDHPPPSWSKHAFSRLATLSGLCSRTDGEAFLRKALDTDSRARRPLSVGHINLAFEEADPQAEPQPEAVPVPEPEPAADVPADSKSLTGQGNQTSPDLGSLPTIAGVRDASTASVHPSELQNDDSPEEGDDYCKNPS
jgi:hypothetical protein